MTNYTPIDCGLHSEYELAIMQRRKIRLTWRDSQEEHRDTVLPEDIHVTTPNTWCSGLKTAASWKSGWTTFSTLNTGARIAGYRDRSQNAAKYREPAIFYSHHHSRHY